MKRALRKTSNHWNFTGGTFPTIGTRVTAMIAVIALLAACGTTKQKSSAGADADAEIALQVNSARAAWQSGNFHRAARYYELALARARALDAATEIARNAYNAAASHLLAGNPADAQFLLIEAGREFARTDLDVSIVLVLQSKAASALGQTAAAETFASNALAVAKTDAAQFDPILALCDLALQRGDMETARERLKAAGRRIGKISGPVAPAQLAAAEGRFLLRNTDAAKAAERFDAAAGGWRNAGNTRELAGALRAAGNAWAAAKNHTNAADRLYRAARSYHGQNDELAALRCIEEALKSADATDDQALHAQIAALFGQIKKSVEPRTE